MKYSKAPISEVIFGVVYAKQKLSSDDIFVLNGGFKDRFPFLEILSPLVIENLDGFQLVSNLDPLLTGPFLLRRRSSDNKWLLQIQSNSVYLNWIRNDSEPVGNYIGYNAVYEQFVCILDTIEKTLDIGMYEDISMVDLSYGDRIEWQKYIPELSKVKDIINISTPPIFSKEGYNNLFARYTYEDSDLNGFGLLNINTATSIQGSQVIKIETVLRGNLQGFTFPTWFEEAHKKQSFIFDGLFTEYLKGEWL